MVSLHWTILSVGVRLKRESCLLNLTLLDFYLYISGFFSVLLPEFSSVIEKADHVTTAFVVIFIRRMTLTMSWLSDLCGNTTRTLIMLSSWILIQNSHNPLIYQWESQFDAIHLAIYNKLVFPIDHKCCFIVNNPLLKQLFFLTIDFQCPLTTKSAKFKL